MLLKLVLLFVAGVVAFTIPDGQADGVYQVSYDASGTEIHTLINYDATASGLENSAKFEKRSFTSGTATCAGEPLLNAADVNTANALLDSTCGYGAYVDDGYSRYAISGCAVSYFCNFGGANFCYSFQRQAASQYVARQCGPDVPGWWTFTDTGLDGSYGNEYFCQLPGSSFCGHSH